jgi:hypothetical protein
VTWRVVGDTRILGVEKGGLIEQRLPQAYASDLVRGGYIAEVVEEEPVVADETAEEAPVAELPKEGD